MNKVNSGSCMEHGAGHRLRVLALSILLAALSADAQSGPSVAVPATATPNPVTGTTTTLNVFGSRRCGRSQSFTYGVCCGSGFQSHSAKMVQTLKELRPLGPLVSMAS